MSTTPGKLLILIPQVYFWESLPINLAHQDTQSKREREAEAQTSPPSLPSPPGEGRVAGEGSILRTLEGQTRTRPQEAAPTHRKGKAAPVLIL